MTRLCEIHGIKFKLVYDEKIFEKSLKVFRAVPGRTPRFGILKIKRARRDFPVPDKAIRVHHNSKRRTSEFVSGSARFYLSPDLAAAVDPPKAHFTIYYKKLNGNTIWHFGQALGWMIKTLALKKNKVYFSGQVFKFGTRTLLVSGQPECGKSRFMKMLRKAGASPLGKNALVEASSGRLSFFESGTAAKQAEAKEMIEKFKFRFDSQGILKLGKIVFISEWNETSGRVERMKIAESLSEFRGLNRRAYEYFPESQVMDFENKYKEILKKISCFRVLMGRDPHSVLKALRNF